MEIIVKDVRATKRWRLEARNYGTNTANARAIRRAFENEHYTRIKRDNEKIEKWREYISKGAVDDLVTTARDLFEAIESELQGKIRFIPGTRVWSEGPYTCVDSSGKGKKGMPISWYAEGSNGLRANLHYSSDVEIEIWRRLEHKEPVLRSVIVFEKELTPSILTKYLGNYNYFRDFGSINGMPRRVESAFNHIPLLRRPLKVKGFPYPHKVSNIRFD